MKLPDLKHKFYGAFIDEAILGPRRELNLRLELWKNNLRRGEGEPVSVRFGGINNFDEVSAFFSGFHESANAHESLHYPDYDRVRKSKPENLFIRIQFDRSEDEALINCKNVSVSSEEPIL